MFRENVQQGIDILVVMETWLKNNNEDTEWAKSTLLVNEPSSFKVKPIQQGCKKTFEPATCYI